uniref:Cathepsin O n=1 Tax=Lygus hesperus TaxID=30085 RepID=A0A0A9XL12_LYGHE
MCSSHFTALGKLLVTVLMTCTLSVHAQLEFLQEPYVGWLAKSEKDNIFLQVWQHYNASSKYVKWYVETTNVYEWSMEENKLRYIFPVNTSDGVQFTECFFDTTNVTWAPFPDPRGFKPLGNNKWSQRDEHLTVSYTNIHGRLVPRLKSRENTRIGVKFEYLNHAPSDELNNWRPVPQTHCPISTGSQDFHIVNVFMKKYLSNAKFTSSGSRELEPAWMMRSPNGWLPNPETNATNFNEIFSTIDISIPPTWDWSKEGVVTDVKNQDKCGSCWAFAVVGVIEGAYARKTNQLRAFSEQYLIDCAWVHGDVLGCFGGQTNKAFEWIKSMQFLPESQEYQYESTNGWCGQRSSSFVHISIKRYGKVEARVEVLKTALYHKGPLLVEFQLPSEIDENKGKTVLKDSTVKPSEAGHSMVLVGYGSCGHLGGEDCFLIKNSWGDKWGVDGYFYVEENTLVELLSQEGASATYLELE